MKKSINTIGTMILIAIVSLLFAGCDYFNRPLLDYLEEWTNTAHIGKHSLDGSYPATGGLTNLPSGGDRVITYYVTNPQSYDLGIEVTFDPSLGWDPIRTDNHPDFSTTSNQGTVEQDPTDKSIIRLTLNKNALASLDGTGSVLNPTISIVEPNSGRNFGSYTVPVRVNTPPPTISSPIILCNTKDNTYVICFNMPDMNTTSSIHQDIVSLTVSGFYNKTYTVTAPGNNSDNGLDNGLTEVSNSYKTDYSEVSGGGAFLGDKNNRFVGIETGVSLTAIPSPECTITLTDSSGLTSAVTASTEAPPLPAVTASSGSGTLEPGVPVTFNQETANSTITLTLSSTEGVSVSGGSFTGDTATGSSGISLTFFKKGTYTVTATAGGITGAKDTTTTFTYTVPYSAVYISENGSNNGQGTPINPFATLEKAIETIGGEGVVYVTGDVIVASEHSHSSGSLTLRGYGSGGTITNSSGRVLNITGGTVTLGGSITLTGTNIGGNGGAVYVAGGSFIMEGNSIITGSSAQNGGGVYIAGGTFTMSDTATIQDNTATTHGGGVHIFSGSTFTMNGGTIGGTAQNTAEYGGGVFVSGGIFNMNDGTISGNTVTQSGGGVYVNDGNFTMAGGTIGGTTANTATQNGGGVHVFGGTFTVSGSRLTITGNTAHNVYLASGKTISIGAGGLTETARIGVTTEGNPNKDGFKITDTAVANGNIIFTSDRGYYVDNKADGVWLRDIEVIYQVDNGPETEATFAEALPKLNGGSAGGTITLLKDISLTQTEAITGGHQSGFNSDTGEGGSPVTIDLNGHTLSGSGSDSVLSVSMGMLEIKDSSSGGTGKITGGGGSSGGGIDVGTNGVLRLVSGAITGNTANEGGGVRVSGKFVMTGGSIQSNTASSQGAGVYVSGIFTMIGGSISSNWAAGNFGAEIQGGGVYIDNGGVVKITGFARITGNQTGVDASTSGMNGGGVYVSENATFKVSGAPTIYWNDNKNSNGTQNDVNIDISSFTRVLITIDGELTGGTIGVSGEGIFTRGCNGNAETYKKFFAAHHVNYAVVVDDASGELKVVLAP